MGKVKVLPKAAANKIAAGEVVERPASVVKELIENSIDAGADEIRVIIKAGGVGEISVYDNGRGMNKEAVLLAPERFATSKIESEKDLDSVKSFGFRGEALSSISSVAKVRIASAAKNEKGFFVEIDGGEVKGKGEIIMDQGTVVKVRDLFYNVPARRKFLKSKRAETRAVAEVVRRYAVSYPEISFELISDGKKLVSADKSEPADRIAEILNDPWAEEPVEIFHSTPSGAAVRGFFAPAEKVKPGRPTQWLFVNKRPVEDKRVRYVVAEAYEAISKRGKPGFVLFAEVPHEEVDVNVHPRKSEVKFKDSSVVYRAIFMAAKQIFKSKPDVVDGGQVPKVGGAGRAAADSKPIAHSHTVQTPEEAISFTQSLLETADREEELHGKAGSEEEAIGWQKDSKILQAGNSYLITELPEGIMIVDQHAAAERILYEKVLTGIQKGEIPMQALVVPVDVEVSGEDLFKGWEEQFEKLGIKAESFGDDMVRIRALPAGVDPKEAGELFLDLLGGIDSAEPSALEENEKDAAAKIACKSAIKFGDPLTGKEADDLLSSLAECGNPLSCPHGRPTTYQIPYKKLEQLFGRT